MTYFSLLSVNGLVMGLIYALMAAGLTLVFSVLKVVNFGHGSLYMLGGYASYYAIGLLGVPPIAGVIVAMVARAYRLDLLPGFPVEPQPGITLRTRHGLLMRLLS